MSFASVRGTARAKDSSLVSFSSLPLPEDSVKKFPFHAFASILSLPAGFGIFVGLPTMIEYTASMRAALP